MWFSQRKGYKSVKNIVQLERMDDNLRNALWNALCEGLFDLEGFFTPNYNNPNRVELLAPQFTDAWWTIFLKKTKDTKPRDFNQIYVEMRESFFRSEWNEVYDLVEFTFSRFPYHKLLEDKINAALESECSGYRVVGQRIVEITNQGELEAVDEALNQKEFSSASKHLHRALELVSDKRNTDPRNSIKESISAVESAAKEITKLPKATLEDAIKTLEKNGELHACLKAGFSKLYAYTSDKGGIRHAMLDEPNLTKADAFFFLVTCSAFINYLKSKV
jgi:hypothetical protein